MWFMIFIDFWYVYSRKQNVIERIYKKSNTSILKLTYFCFQISYPYHISRFLMVFSPRGIFHQQCHIKINVKHTYFIRYLVMLIWVIRIIPPHQVNIVSIWWGTMGSYSNAHVAPFSGCSSQKGARRGSFLPKKKILWKSEIIRIFSKSFSKFSNRFKLFVENSKLLFKSYSGVC